MGKTSKDFLSEINPSFMRIISPMFGSITIVMDEYKTHIKKTPKPEQKTPKDFLAEQDFVLEMFSKQHGCYDDILLVIENWAKT